MTPLKISQILTHIAQFSFLFAEKFPEFTFYRIRNFCSEIQVVWQSGPEEIVLDFSEEDFLVSFYGEYHHQENASILNRNTTVVDIIKKFQQEDKE